MNVLIFIASIDKKGGGPSRSVPILAKGLVQNGINVTLMTIKSEDMNSHAINGTNVKLITLPESISYVELEKVILKEHYDIIHNQMIWLPIYNKVAKIARKHGIPYLTTPRGTLEPWAYTGQGLVKTIKKKTAMLLYQKKDIECASCVLTTAEMERQSMRKLGYNSPIAVIPNGIDIDKYPCRLASKYDNVKKQILFLSRIHPKKGIEVLINAWANIVPYYPNWNVVIVGNGESNYIKILDHLIQEKKIDSSVKILPPAFDDNKYKLYSESSLFCLPSYSENYGMVIAEALSCGVPVITTKGTPWELLLTSKSGWWIELTQENLERTLKEAINCGTKELFEMGQRGSQMVRENFYYIEVAKKLKEVYEWILGKVERPDCVSL